jgi:hypothetical protein
MITRHLLDGLALFGLEHGEVLQEVQHMRRFHPQQPAAGKLRGGLQLKEGRIDKVAGYRAEGLLEATPPNLTGVGRACRRASSRRISARARDFEVWLSDHVAQRDQVPKHVAMQTARHQYPQSYTTYQGQLSDRSSRRQAMARGYHLMAAKSAGPDTYEEMLANEMIAKGVNMEVAGQRLAQAFGFEATRNRTFAKNDQTTVKRFQAEVEKIMYEDGCDATEATRLARIENPLLFKAMQII